MPHGLVKYPATASGVKRGLSRLRRLHGPAGTQKAAALATDQSQALISLVLAGKAKSQPCLDKLAGYIAERLAPERQHEEVVA